VHKDWNSSLSLVRVRVKAITAAVCSGPLRLILLLKLSALDAWGLLCRNGRRCSEQRFSWVLSYVELGSAAALTLELLFQWE
jgi:hypothetical protein